MSKYSYVNQTPANSSLAANRTSGGGGGAVGGSQDGSKRDSWRRRSMSHVVVLPSENTGTCEEWTFGIYQDHIIL